MLNLLVQILSLLFLIVPIIVIIAFYTLVERKFMGAVQRRRGPNVAGFLGLLQPIADGIKLLLKEPLVPRKANYYLFYFAPIITFTLSFVIWSFIPITLFHFLLDSNVGLLLLFSISSLSIFGIIGAGWASNSKYALLGALRSAAQMISYEISLGFIFLSVSLLSESLNLFDIILMQRNIPNFLPLFPLVLIFYVSMLAETNRAPFDLPEAEAEIVAGYNVEYSGISFALFFLGEYSNMFLMSILFVILFFGGNIGLSYFDLFSFVFKIVIVATSFIFIRSILPRVRYDQLMYLGWQVFLPFTLGFFIFLSSLLYLDDLNSYALNLESSEVSFYLVYLPW
jgi:NADH-quinone oxidoreductase subunit H